MAIVTFTLYDVKSGIKAVAELKKACSEMKIPNRINKQLYNFFTYTYPRKFNRRPVTISVSVDKIWDFVRHINVMNRQYGLRFIIDEKSYNYHGKPISLKETSAEVVPEIVDPISEFLDKYHLNQIQPFDFNGYEIKKIDKNQGTYLIELEHDIVLTIPEDQLPDLK